MTQSVTTKYYRTSPGRYVRQASMIWMGKWWWTLAMPIVALIAAGIYDARFYIVALGVLLIVYPMIMANIYFNHALRPEAALAVIPHSLTISPDSIVITYQEQEGYSTPRPRQISRRDIAETEDTGSSLIIHLKSGKYDFIEIPTEAFEPGDMSKSLVMLTIINDLA